MTITAGQAGYAVYYNVAGTLDGADYIGSNTLTMPVSSTVGDVISFAVDFDNRMIWCRLNNGNWNNNASANPATNVGGLPLPTLASGTIFEAFFMGCDTGYTGEQTTVRANPSTFTQSVPSGFLPWNPATVPVVTGNSVDVSVGDVALKFAFKLSITGTQANVSVGTANVTIGNRVGGQSLTAAVGTVNVLTSAVLSQAGYLLTATTDNVTALGGFINGNGLAAVVSVGEVRLKIWDIKPVSQSPIENWVPVERSDGRMLG
jgi:hypothetical protein